MKYKALILSLFTMTSCVCHSGLITTNSSNNDINCKYVDIAVGYSKVSYFLGIGGFKKDALISEAKRNLYLYPIGSSQTFENITLDLKTTYIFPYKKVEAIIVADIIEHNKDLNISHGEHYMNIMGKNSLQNNQYFKLNDSIEYVNNNGETIIGKIIKMDNKSITFYLFDNKGLLKIKTSLYENIFKFKNVEELQRISGFKINDTVSFKISNMNLEGNILALNNEFALVRTAIGDKTIRICVLKKK